MVEMVRPTSSGQNSKNRSSQTTNIFMSPKWLQWLGLLVVVRYLLMHNNMTLLMYHLHSLYRQIKKFN